MTKGYESEKEEAIKEISRQWVPLDKEQEKLFKDNISIEKFNKGEGIYSDEAFPTHLFYLIKGNVKIYKNGIGKAQIIRAIKPVDPFGYRAYFAGEDYKTAAMALDKCTVAKIPFNIVSTILAHNYQFGLSLIKHLSIEIGKSDSRTINLTQKHIRGRLAETLLFLKDSYGVDADGCTLSVYLSREDIANMSNMTTSNAIRTLSAFANEGLIVIDGRKIKIIDDAELRRISEGGRKVISKMEI